MKPCFFSIALILCINASMNAQTTSSQWVNPLPQGSSLTAVSFTDASTGTAVGDIGSIVRTTDHGASWIEVDEALPALDAYAGSLAIDALGDMIAGSIDSGTFPKVQSASTISGMKFNDINANSVKDTGELGLAGWMIKTTGPVNDSTTTDSTGNYSFSNLTGGTYIVSEVQQADWIQTYPPAVGTYTLTISGSETVTGIDFGNVSGFRYIGPSGGSWSDSANWSGGDPPDPENPGIIPGNIQCVVDFLPNDSIKALRVEAGGRLTFSTSAGRLKISGAVRNDSGAIIEFPPENTSTGMICYSDFVNSGTFAPGHSTVILAGNKPKAIVTSPHSPSSAPPKQVAALQQLNSVTNFYNLTVQGENASSIGNISVNNQLTLEFSLAQRLQDTILIANASHLALLGTGRVLRGTIQRTIQQSSIQPYQFESSNSFIQFADTGVYPSVITMTSYPDTTPTNFANQWIVVPSTIDTLNNIITADGVTHFSKWAFGRPRPTQIEPSMPVKALVDTVPVIRRVYEINQQGGSGFRARLALHYEQSQVPPGIPEDSLLLLRSDTPTLVFDQTYTDGWNMISLPLHVLDNKKATLFPTASSRAFAYVGSYQTRDTIESGRGYWLKFGGPTTIALEGFQDSDDTLQVYPRWNMIGSISVPVPVNTITSAPSGLVVSSFFRYSSPIGHYETADTIEPGHGYWVKTNQAGKLILSSSATALPQNRLRILYANELPPSPPAEERSNLQPQSPNRFGLEQNYPNPFNPLTGIRYQIADRSHVTLEIYNMLGQEVARLVDEMQDPGFKSTVWDANGLPSGVYYYRLTAQGFSDVKKVLLIK